MFLDFVFVTQSDMSKHEILCVSGFFSESECHLIGKEVITWNGHTMGLFMDKSIETCHGKIRHMERTHPQLCLQEKDCWKGKG